MSQLTNLELEGRLNAQRKILALVLAHLDPEAERLIEEVVALRTELQNHQEDPGAISSEAFAIEAAMAAEMDLIVRRAHEHRSEPERG